MRGITITNYLLTGNPEGIIKSYLSNWNGQAIKIPRNIFFNTANEPELKRPGLYFLFGNNPENPDDKWVYVGEANNLYDRLRQHLVDERKSFFDTIICFSSKDNVLTVSHTKYLEKLALVNTPRNGLYSLKNETSGTSVSLPKMVEDEMETFFDNIKIIIPTLGFNLFHSNTYTNTNTAQTNSRFNVEFKLNVSTIKASAKLNTDSFEVIAGSTATKRPADSLSTGYINLRNILIEKGILVESGDNLRFAKNYEFISSTAAAQIILGYSVSGPATWKMNDNKSLKEYEESLVNSQ